MEKNTRERIRKFIVERDFDKFHTPANLAKSIAIEASELLECFQWDEENFDINNVKDELADVIIYAYDLIEKLKLNDDEIINNKMDKNEKKYPVDKCRGTSTKYNKL